LTPEFSEKLPPEKNMTVKEYILKCANNVKEALDKDYAASIEGFIKDPYIFYDVVRAMHNGDIALFEVPCKYCGIPIVFTHKNKYWGDRHKAHAIKSIQRPAPCKV